MVEFFASPLTFMIVQQLALPKKLWDTTYKFVREQNLFICFHTLLLLGVTF